MTTSFRAYAVGFAAAVALVSFVRAQETSVPDTPQLERMTARFAPTEIGMDLSKLSSADRQVLAKLVAGFENHRRAVPAAGHGAATRRC